MQADPEQRVTAGTEQSGPPTVPIIAGIVVLVALGVWLFSGDDETAQVSEPAPVAESVAPEPAPEPAPELEAAPDIPAPVPDAVPEPAPPEPEFTLESSDEPLRASLQPALSPVLKPALEASDLLERGVAVVDGLSRGVLRYKLLPLTPPEAKFTTRETAGQAYLDPSGYARYDDYAGAIDSLDTAELTQTFHRFRPLLEEAYGYLGYQPDNVDNALIRALDLIIAAPVLDEPPQVRKVEAVYKYEDPTLERLPGIQKQLLRMGPENTRRIQRQARALRAALLGEPPDG